MVEARTSEDVHKALSSASTSMTSCSGLRCMEEGLAGPDLRKTAVGEKRWGREVESGCCHRRSKVFSSSFPSASRISSTFFFLVKVFLPLCVKMRSWEKGRNQDQKLEKFPICVKGCSVDRILLEHCACPHVHRCLSHACGTAQCCQ